MSMVRSRLVHRVRSKIRHGPWAVALFFLVRTLCGVILPYLVRSERIPLMNESAACIKTATPLGLAPYIETASWETRVQSLGAGPSATFSNHEKTRACRRGGACSRGRIPI